MNLLEPVRTVRYRIAPVPAVWWTFCSLIFFEYRKIAQNITSTTVPVVKNIRVELKLL